MAKDTYPVVKRPATEGEARAVLAEAMAAAAAPGEVVKTRAGDQVGELGVNIVRSACAALRVLHKTVEAQSDEQIEAAEKVLDGIALGKLPGGKRVGARTILRVHEYRHQRAMDLAKMAQDAAAARLPAVGATVNVTVGAVQAAAELKEVQAAVDVPAEPAVQEGGAV